MAESDVPSEWTEVNITPTSWEQRESLLVDLVDPLIHQTLSGRVADWHYFWEPALRLRVRWKHPTRGDLNGLTNLLDAAKADGRLAVWETGSHGDPSKIYAGEAADYGPEVWEQTYKDWTSGSELALSIVKHDSTTGLTKPRWHHWHRRVHLFLNELGFGHFQEGLWSFNQATGYLDAARKGSDPITSDPEISALIDEIAGKAGQLGGAIQRWINGKQTRG